MPQNHRASRDGERTPFDIRPGKLVEHVQRAARSSRRRSTSCIGGRYAYASLTAISVEKLQNGEHAAVVLGNGA
jgi:hypothetical protein